MASADSEALDSNDGAARGRVGRRVMPARSLARRRRILRRGIYLLDRRFLRRPEQYFVQALLATITLSILVAVEDALTNAATVTAIASTAFIVFMAPHSKLAGPRRVLGGHGIGLIIGLAASGLATEVFGGGTVAIDLAAAVAVGTSMLVMASTDTEHPPAAGTVLGIVLASDPWNPALMVAVAAAALSAARQLFGRWMIDLAH